MNKTNSIPKMTVKKKLSEGFAVFLRYFTNIKKKIKNVIEFYSSVTNQNIIILKTLPNLIFGFFF